MSVAQHTRVNEEQPAIICDGVYITICCHFSSYTRALSSSFLCLTRHEYSWKAFKLQTPNERGRKKQSTKKICSSTPAQVSTTTSTDALLPSGNQQFVFMKLHTTTRAKNHQRKMKKIFTFSHVFSINLPPILMRWVSCCVGDFWRWFKFKDSRVWWLISVAKETSAKIDWIFRHKFSTSLIRTATHKFFRIQTASNFSPKTQNGQTHFPSLQQIVPHCGSRCWRESRESERKLWWKKMFLKQKSAEFGWKFPLIFFLLFSRHEPTHSVLHRHTKLHDDGSNSSSFWSRGQLTGDAHSTWHNKNWNFLWWFRCAVATTIAEKGETEKKSQAVFHIYILKCDVRVMFPPSTLSTLIVIASHETTTHSAAQQCGKSEQMYERQRDTLVKIIFIFIFQCCALPRFISLLFSGIHDNSVPTASQCAPLSLSHRWNW